MEQKLAKELHAERNVLWNSSIAKHAKYIDSTTGLFDSRYVENRTCPVCDGASHRHLFHKEGGTYVSCEECEMVFLNPVFKADALNDYYQNNHEIQAQIVEMDTPFYTEIYSKGLSLISSAGVKQQKILDFGCSAGFFLDLARRSGWSGTHGIELNRKEFQVAVTKGHQVHNDRIENVRFTDRFDAITLWDVFEHLTDGSFFLQLFKKFLAPDGVVFLQIPNAMGLAPRLMREECNMFDGLEHVNLYGPETLKQLARRNGYDIVQMTSVIPELNVLNNYTHYDHPYNGRMPATNSFLGLATGEDILQKMLGYKLQAVLKLA